MKKKRYIISYSLIVTLLVSIIIYWGNGSLQRNRLFSAIENGDCAAAQIAIDCGADVNSHRYKIYVDDIVMMNPTPLVQACKNGDEAMVKLLLSNGADINTPDSITGKTPLLSALHGTKANRFSLASYLIEHGADIHVVLDNNSPVAECLYISKKDSYETIKQGYQLFQQLIESGASIDSIPFAENALTYATHYGNYNAVDYLLKNKYFGVNDYDDGGNTALLVAAKYNQVDLTEYLLTLGADPQLTDSVGKTAYDYAMEYGFSDILALLEN